MLAGRTARNAGRLIRNTVPKTYFGKTKAQKVIKARTQLHIDIICKYAAQLFLAALMQYTVSKLTKYFSHTITVPSQHL